MRFYSVLLVSILIIPLVWYADSATFYKVCGYIIKIALTLASLNILLMLWLFKSKKQSEVTITDECYVDQDGIKWGHGRW